MPWGSMAVQRPWGLTLGTPFPATPYLSYIELLHNSSVNKVFPSFKKKKKNLENVSPPYAALFSSSCFTISGTV